MHLNVSDKISIINSLMAEDRQEVRTHQNSLWNISYIMVAASVGVAAFYFDKSSSHPTLKDVLMVGEALFLLLYVAVFLMTAFKWLPDARACLTIREAYYHNPNLLFQEAFIPLRSTKEKDYRNSVIDRYLWFPFAVSVVSAGTTLLFLFYS